MFNICFNSLIALMEAFSFYIYVYAKAPLTQPKKNYFMYNSFISIVFILRRLALSNFQIGVSNQTFFDPLFYFINVTLLCSLKETTRPNAWRIIIEFHLLQTICFMSIKYVSNCVFSSPANARFPYELLYFYEFIVICIYAFTTHMLVILIYMLCQRNTVLPLKADYMILLLLPSILFTIRLLVASPETFDQAISPSQLLICFFQLCANIIVWMIYLDLLQQNQQIYYQNKYYKEQEQFFLKHKEAHHTMRKLIHDQNKHYHMILGLLQTQDIRKTIEYVQSLELGLKQICNHTFTGNKDVDIILSAHYSEISQAGGHLNIKGGLPTTLKIDPVDFCILLGNCLENALRACLMTDNRQITITFTYYRGLCRILIRNPYSPTSLTALPPPFRSPSQHHLGMQIVSSVTRKYNGQLQVLHKNGFHEIDLLLIEPSNHSLQRNI